MSETHPSVRKRLAQIICSIFFCLTSAGVIFGFAALKPVLVREGVYSDLCPPSDDGSKFTIQDEEHIPCLEQDLRLNLMFTAGTVVTNVIALPVGYLLDKIGPKYTSISGGVIFTLGCLCFGTGIVTDAFDSYLAGYIILAVGGPLIFLSQFHLSNAFPKNAGLILSAITGAFDASSLPVVLYREIYFATNGALSLKAWWWCYSIIGVLVVVEHIFLGPQVLYSNVPQELQQNSQEPSERTPLVNERAHKKKRSVFKDPLNGMMFGVPALKQIGSSWFWLITFFLCAHMLRINLYIQTAHSQLLYYTGDTHLADSLTKAFTYLLPIGGAVGVPFIGALLDRRPIRDAFSILFVMGLLFGGFGLASHSPLQLISIGILVVLRPLMYTIVSNYSAKVFGFETFGTVYGLVNTLAGLFGLVQYPIDLLIKQTLEGDYTPVNIVLLIAGAVTTAAVITRVWLGTRNRSIAQVPSPHLA